LTLGNWQQEARDDYHAATDHMTDEQKDDYRQHLFDVLGSAMKKELKTVSPASRMTKVEKHIMHFVRVCYTTGTILTLSLVDEHFEGTS